MSTVDGNDFNCFKTKNRYNYSTTIMLYLRSNINQVDSKKICLVSYRSNDDRSPANYNFSLKLYNACNNLVSSCNYMYIFKLVVDLITKLMRTDNNFSASEDWKVQ